MSQSQQGGQSRQPVSYPSPTGYPSPGLVNAQYSYPAPNNQQASEQQPYRASPTGSNGSLSLPSMRSLDPLQQQTHQQHMGSPMPAPYYHSNSTLPHPQHQYPNVTSDPSGQNMRYALPAPDNRVMSGGRHKKEIKRRTKTGCLTCRKRRIKCDEAHPACRNCQKSKRECLGYDPIFKQQPGPAPIQPAPSSAPSQASISAPSNPYGNQPSMLQGYGAQVPNMGYEPALSAGVSSPGSASQQFDYSSAIDPALEAAAPPPGHANQFQQSGMSNFRDDLKRELQSTSPYSSGASDSPHIRGGASFLSPSSSQFTQEESSTYTTVSAKPTRIDDLLLNIPPKPSDFAPDDSQLEEIKHLFFSIYVPGLENFLESKFYANKGITFLLNDKRLLGQFTILLEQFAKTAADDQREMSLTGSVEGRVVWSLASMVRTAGEITNGINKPESQTMPANDDAVEAAHRLQVFESLICGVVATRNPLAKPIPGTGDHHRLRELEFWWTLSKFTTLKDDEASSAKDIDETLSALRNLLDGRENRDVLYSIAVVRAIGQRVSEYAETDQPLHLDEQDARSKLAVAKRFVKDEANGNGTTNVIRRLCEVATQSWNVTRATK